MNSCMNLCIYFVYIYFLIFLFISIFFSSDKGQVCASPTSVSPVFHSLRWPGRSPSRSVTLKHPLISTNYHDVLLSSTACGNTPFGGRIWSGLENITSLAARLFDKVEPGVTKSKEAEGWERLNVLISNTVYSPTSKAAHRTGPGNPRGGEARPPRVSSHNTQISLLSLSLSE